MKYKLLKEAALAELREMDEGMPEFEGAQGGSCTDELRNFIDSHSA